MDLGNENTEEEQEQESTETPVAVGASEEVASIEDAPAGEISVPTTVAPEVEELPVPVVVEGQADEEPAAEQEAAPVEAATEQPAMGEEEPAAEQEAAPEAESEEDDDAPKPKIPKLEPHRASLPWYAVHTYAGYESRVKLGLEERIRSENLEDKFGNVLVPEETVVELQKGTKKTSSRKLFPSYILVQIDLDDETWHLVNATPKVTGFVGDSRNPTPLSEEEVKSLVAQMEGGASRPKPKVSFEEGDPIKVIDGPFAEFNGTVDEVKPDKGKLRVLISIFGRNTPVELDFVQVEKV